MWQEIIVVLMVAAALLHFSTRYLPLAWRRRIVHTLGQRGLDQNRLARLFKTEGGGGCGDSGDGGCSSCGSCDSTPAANHAAPDHAAPKHRVIKLHVQR